MMTIRPFKVADLVAFEVQARHRGLAALVAEHDLVRDDQPWAFTAVVDGIPVACAGINRGMTWAFLGSDMRRHMVGVTRAVRDALIIHSRVIGPTITLIDPDYPEAVRWARALGLRRVEGSNTPGREEWIYHAPL